jgi:ribosomal protein S12 methylthiotransferase accessory factor
MDMEITFPGGKRVAASWDGQRVETDQPVSGGGQGSAPAPYDLFLASLGTCAGIYALGFLQARGLPTEGLALRQHVTNDPQTGLATSVTLEVTLPPGTPEKYRAGVLRAAEHCKVKKTLGAPPAFSVVLAGTEAGPAATRAA